jgi:drug/metabolite transporter (DMT)-like permease
MAAQPEPVSQSLNSSAPDRVFRQRVLIALALLAVYFVWGSTYLAILLALEGFPPMLMAGVRFLMAGIALYAALRLRGAAAPTRRQWLWSGAIGTLLLVGGNGGVVVAEQWVVSGVAALGVATVPLWAALFGGLWGRWPRRIEWLGLLIGFAGVVLLNLGGDLRSQPLGALALLVAAVSWAFGSVWSKRLDLPGGLMASAAQMLGASGVFLLLSASLGERLDGPPGLRAVLALLYLIVFGALVAFSAYTFLLRRVSPALATSYAYVNPAVAIALGVLLANERISTTAIVAMIVILGGVALIGAGRGRS